MTTAPSASLATEHKSPAGWVDPKVNRELRIAVTMNGGVSLAVYIGGVAHELDRFTRESGGYFELLKKFGYAKTPPVIDVITGTSAGGINAAALALAQANTQGDLGLLKELWIQHGQIGDLLREPFHRGPASLLKGDDYFYPQIRSAFRRLTQNFVRAPDAASDGGPRPVDLTIPVTLLTPVESELTDYLGTAVVQAQHAGLFHFRGGTGDPESKGKPIDMFSLERIKKGKRETVEALALAARASAGFPAAFEPTFIPVHHHGKTADGRPDMADYADWAQAGKDLSRFAVDGGVLANTPTRPALEGIRTREVTQTMVRRVLILVHPHAEYAPDIKDVADDALDPPTLVGALGGVARASGSVGSRKYVEEIKQHNELALQWRDGRQAAMAEFDAERLTKFLGEPPDYEQPAWQLFRKLRLRRGAYVSASSIRGQFETPFAKLIEYAVEILEEDGRAGDLAFLPTMPPGCGDFDLEVWRWGLNLAVGVASQATELLRQLINGQVDIPGKYHDAIVQRANTAWKKASNGVVLLERLVDEEFRSEAEKSQDTATDSAGGAPGGAAATNSQDRFERERIRRCLRDNLSGYNKQMLLSADEKGRDTRGKKAVDTLRGIVTTLLDVITTLDTNDINVDDTTGRGEQGKPAALLLRKNPLRGADSGDTLLKRMLQIETIAYLTAEHDSTDGSVPTVPIDFVQHSAHIEQDFARNLTADGKLAGLSLHRFGAFLKRSWRANDWIWGRLDAIKILMLIVLTPEIIRGYRMRYYADFNEPAKDIVDDIARAAFHNNLTLYDKLAAGSLKEVRCKAENDVAQAILGDDAPMENLASLAAYGLQAAVAKEDVPWLAGTIRDDRDDGAIGAETAQFLERLGQREDSLDGYTLLTRFAESRIGQEAVADQMPSDLMIRTTATAAATAVTALSAEESGLGFARPATKVARGMIALPYWALLALTGRGHIARAVATVLLALGVSLTALSLITDLPGLMGKLVPTIGVASLLTVFGYATLRTQSIAHGAALLGLFIPVIAYAVDSGKADAQTDIVGATRVSLIWVVVLLAWVLVVANLTPHTRSPATLLLRAVRALKAFWIETRRTLILVGGVSAAAGLGVFFGRHVRTQWYRDSGLSALVTDLVHAFGRRPWDGDVCSWMTLVLLAAAVAGFAITWQKSLRFRPPGRADSRPHTRPVDPAWLATAWSPVYGLLYLGAGVLLVPLAGKPVPQWARTASMVAVMLGLFFSLVAVNLIPHLRENRLIRRLVTHFEPDQVPNKPTSVKAFDALGESAGYLVKQRKSIQLTRHGQRVWRRAHRISARKAASKAQRRPIRSTPRSLRIRRHKTRSDGPPTAQRCDTNAVTPELAGHGLTTARIESADGLPVIHLPAGAPPISPETVQRALDED